LKERKLGWDLLKRGMWGHCHQRKEHRQTTHRPPRARDSRLPCPRSRTDQR
jgi:hypothetical protein